MSKKWYNLFVSVDDGDKNPAPDDSTSPDSESDAKSAAQSIADIAKSVVAEQPTFTAPISNAASFEEIYKAAEIPAAPQGYSIFKVAEMLQSEHIRSLPADVKRSSILVALDAAGVNIKDVIQDAVRRDHALDTFESVQQRALEEMETRITKENSQIQAEIDRLVAEQKAKIQKNTDQVSQEKERLFGWRLKKQQEEKRISDAVSYFVTENPITTGSGGPAAPPSKPPARS
ncbi:MAG TPA: hypothetical protein VKZ53_24900 [Candidatus Angelobacter sp.]|nr:hypothetical protein [Candidatus Angelobacter sp.]